MSINFDRAADYYDATRGYAPEIASAIGKALGAAANATPRTRFLEIGVGTGRIALPVIARGYDYTGVDISTRMMERLREKVTEMEQRSGSPLRVTLREADMLALPFADGSFDAVIAAHVFHLVADSRKAAQEALRVLHPAGVLLMCGDTTSSQEAVSVTEAWRGFVRAAHGNIPSSAEVSERVLAELQAADPSLRVEELRPVTWSFTTTAAEELDTIRKRLWSNTWALPDAVFEQCMARLVAWCDATFAGRLDTPLPRTATFVIHKVFRSPTA